MAWTAPATYTVGQLLTAASLNTNVKDNTLYLYAASTLGIYRKTTSKTVNTSVAETDLLNGEITIAANTIGSSGVLRLTAWGDWKQNSGGGADVPRFKLKLGAVTLLDTGAPAATITNAVTRYGWKIAADIINLGTTNSQWATLDVNTSAVLTTANVGAFATGEGNYIVPAGISVNVIRGLGSNSGAVDTTASQALVLSVINASASGNYETVLNGAIITISSSS